MSEQNWDHTYDVVVVGSGGAAFATALGAADSGLRVLMIESTDQWGGSTSMSGGGMWLPNNPLMQRDGAGDSREEALRYMAESIGDVGRASSDERREAFVDSVGDFVTTAERYGIKFARAAEYPDYYPERPGGKIGRSIECAPTDAKRIGEWWQTCRGRTSGVAFPMMTDDMWLLSRSWVTPAGFLRGATLVSRVAKMAVKRQTLVGCGAALAVNFCDVVVQQLGVPLWLNAPLEELIVEDGRVAGVRTVKDGNPVRVQATRGVMLGAGGFAANDEMRATHQGLTENWTSANPGNQGKPIVLAQAVGADVGLMDDAWWGGSIPFEGPTGGKASFIVAERSLPYSIIVDAEGRRFCNESESYVDLGHHMLEHPVKGKFWMVCDARHGRRYLRTFFLDPKTNKRMEEAGVVVRGASVEELAGKLGMEPEVLRETVDRFNGFARSGKDGDFGRGNSAYDRYYGDPTVLPNPNLGPLEKGPFIAFQVAVGDLGTKGGVMTDEFGRALRVDGSVIEGLYAAGNNSASVMGRTYPGPGSTIGPAVVFGIRAGRHMAQA